MKITSWTVAELYCVMHKKKTIEFLAHPVDYVLRCMSAFLCSREPNKKDWIWQLRRSLRPRRHDSATLRRGRTKIEFDNDDSTPARVDKPSPSHSLGPASGCVDQVSTSLDWICWRWRGTSSYASKNRFVVRGRDLDKNHCTVGADGSIQRTCGHGSVDCSWKEDET